MADDLASRLRAADENDVAVAMEKAPFPEPKNDAELLAFFNLMLDVLGVPDADGDVFEPSN